MHFTNYLNRQPPSLSILTPSSVLCFLLNNEDFDYALVVADLKSRKLILYDCVEGRPKDTFYLHIKKLRVFLKDFFEERPMKISVQDNESSENQSDQALSVQIQKLSLEDGGEENYVSEDRRKSEMKLDQVDLWKYESGICTKYPSQIT